VDNQDMSISKRLDTAMTHARYPSQAALSRASGVPQPTINRILKGTGARGPETTTLAKLAAACKVNFEWLLTGNGPMAQAKDARQHAGVDVIYPAPPESEIPKGKPLQPVLLAAMGVITANEAQLLNWYRMSYAEGKKIIEATARGAPKKQPSAVIDDQAQDTRPGTSNGNRL
jgi:transcriptional regulator with XRE-family HTH domain